MSEFVTPEGAGEVPEFRPASSATAAKRRPCVQTVNRWGVPLPDGFDCAGWSVNDDLHKFDKCGAIQACCLHHEYLPAGGEA